MARVTNDGITGAVGNVVFVSMNGKTYMRTKPKPAPKRKPSKQKEQNRLFGLCSTAASAMGNILKPSVHFAFNAWSFNQLRGWLRKEYAVNYKEETWALSAATGAQCQLNTHCDLRDQFHVPFSVKDMGAGKIRVQIPAFNPVKQIKAPTGTAKVVIKFIPTAHDFNNPGLSSYYPVYTHEVDYENSTTRAKSILLQPIHKETNQMLLLTIALSYYNTNGDVFMIERYLPAAVVAMGRMGG